MRASRLVSTLLLLQNRGRMTARELADELEVSVRTVYRDMESLSAAGIPVYAEPGHDGGYELLDGYRTRLTGLTVGEAESLFLTGLPGAAADLGLGAVVTAAQLKLTAALPVELRDRAGRISQRFHLDAVSWYQDGDHTPHLTLVADAVWNQREVRLRYERWAAPQEVTRTVQPYGLVLKAGHWYLVARSAGGLRTYRVSRILDAETRSGTFDREPGFDLAGYWQDYLRNFDARRHQHTATVRLSRDALTRLPDLLEPALVEAARRTATEPGPDGWIEVTLPVESAEHTLPELLKLGADAEIVAPEGFRDRIAEIARAMARLYPS
ncbi:putative DNA-binding transcriptional regulator YafY [Amycolatopsis endophytica]|uniref:Putative DNA-binding transcriptional regulator YafY n=1 Tax=Amycolatopsis endophytica TaxID=860233 RepID=A0A853B5P4_9PSEU|nr:YafY family protein [Amycolatopsis endophytica]NYI90097.1 putative DNA-binding transcriptional regulator YafY [Amycolatopsis endophytica]